METISSTFGWETDPELADQLHKMEHDGHVERIYLGETLIGRRRFRATSDRGNEYGIILDGDPARIDGRVLILEPDRAVVLHQGEPETLTLRATDIEAGIQLGWHAGHLHWRVRFDGDLVVVLLDGPAEDYLARISPYVTAGQIAIVSS
ncbi:hypothetical protein [Microbacterium sp.]|uniref:hypothetical protein n=1 Tax=Microbacterium sp. TaxID=51671 RepID=UPI003A9245D4